MTDSDTKSLSENDLERVVAELGRYIDSQIELEDACRKGRKLIRQKWCRAMLDELMQYDEPDIPYAPKDSPYHPQWAEAATKRVILFLRSGRVYQDGRGRIEKILGLAFAVTFFGGAISFLGLGTVNQFIVEAAWMERALEWIAVTIAICIGILFFFYALSLMAAGAQIFRVRILRQDLTPEPDSDIWPYLNREDYDRDKQASESSLQPLPTAP